VKDEDMAALIADGFQRIERAVKESGHDICLQLDRIGDKVGQSDSLVAMLLNEILDEKKSRELKAKVAADIEPESELVRVRDSGLTCGACQFGRKIFGQFVPVIECGNEDGLSYGKNISEYADGCKHWLPVDD